jgi:pyridoxamine 5'-phosphate oxidase
MTQPRRQDRPLSEHDLHPDPLIQFARWFEEARELGGFEAEAMTLATATADGAPSARMVLMKGFDTRGIRFFTNYGSRKAVELAANPRAALLFDWPALGRQVRIEGTAAKIERDETEQYARSRMPASQLSALASPQSRPVPDREWLERRVAEIEREYAGRELPVGDDWGGYRVSATVWEFWQHRENRLHDRFRYEPDGSGGWREPERLGP